MPRAYSVVFSGVSVTAAQDLFQIIGAAGKTLKVKRIALSDVDTTLPAGQMLQLRARFLPATVSNGSGGSSPTPQPMDPGDAAASFTAKANNTSKATTSGTAVVLYAGGCHLFSGLDYSFTKEPIIGPSEAFVFELLSTVSATCIMSGQVDVEEIGG
jgi:hypothetical protein